MAAVRTGHVVDFPAHPEQALPQDANSRQRIAGRDAVHDSIKNGRCRYLQIPGTPLGNEYLADLLPTPATGASPGSRHRLPARARPALPLFSQLSEVTDLGTGVVKTLPCHLGARAGARGVPRLHRNGQSGGAGHRARRVTCAPAQLRSELKTKPPPVETAADPVQVRAIVMPCAPAGRCQLAFLVHRVTPAGRRTGSIGGADCPRCGQGAARAGYPARRLAR